MRGCTCPKDGSYYCEWCKVLAARAHITLDVTDTTPGLQRSAVHVLPMQNPFTADIHPQFRSKTEARYAQLLDARKADKLIHQYWYEPFGLRLGAKSHYHPDFLIQRPETPLLELVEVKGSWIRDRAMDKPKAAATRYPCFIFTLAVWDRQTWTETRIQAHL